MKNWKIFLVIALVLVTVLALASCGNNCEHPAYDEAITQKPTCTAEGVKTFTCTACGDTYTEPIPVVEHDYDIKGQNATCVLPGKMIYTCKVCGHSYEEEVEAARGHNYNAVVTPATCKAGGYTTYTCTCGDTYVGDETPISSSHNYQTVVVELTAEQAALNPGAIGIEKLVCPDCGDSKTTENAILVFMDFNTVPDAEAYEGSDLYKTLIATEKVVTFMSQNPDSKPAFAYIDSQANADMWTSNSWGMHMKGDGKLTMNSLPSYWTENFQIGSKKAAFTDVTYSFDLIINDSPVGFSNEKFRAVQLFFALQDEKLYNNIPVGLGLSNTNLGEGDEVIAELIVFSKNEGKVDDENSRAHATGYHITVGQEYSYKVTVHSETDNYKVTVFVKAAGEAEYTEIGTYDFVPHTRDRKTCVSFGLSSQGSGNVLDNYKVTIPLAK